MAINTWKKRKDRDLQITIYFFLGDSDYFYCCTPSLSSSASECLMIAICCFFSKLCPHFISPLGNTYLVKPLRMKIKVPKEIWICICFLFSIVWCWYLPAVAYGITGCGVFKAGIQNWKGFCIKFNCSQMNLLNFENWTNGEPQ